MLDLYHCRKYTTCIPVSKFLLFCFVFFLLLMGLIVCNRYHELARTYNAENLCDLLQNDTRFAFTKSLVSIFSNSSSSSSPNKNEDRYHPIHSH